MREHGGQITATPNGADPDEAGACFNLVFPAFDASQATERRAAVLPVAGEPGAVGQPKGPVLVVGDEEAIVLPTLVDGLERLGFEVLMATNGKDALALLDQFSVRVLLTDLVMPTMGGMELIASARANSPQTVTVLMSGNLPDEDRQTAEELGVFGFLPKPFRVREMTQMVERALAAHDPERAP